MATGAKSGSTRKRTTSGGRVSGSRKRTTSKPLIIDVEADAKAEAKVESAAPASPAAPAPSSGLDESAAKAAGLSADPVAEPKADIAASPKSEPDSDLTPSMDAPAGSTDSPKPPAGNKEPSPFYLFAAGLIGALLAMVLMFIASVVGLFSLSDGRVDDQAAALAALETRVSAVEADSAPPFDPAVLVPLQSELAALRSDLEAMVAAPVSDGSDVDASAPLAEALAPFEGRLTAVESALQSTVEALAAADTGESAVVVAPDPALAQSVAALSGALENAQADLTGLQDQVEALATAPGTLPPETEARLNALDGLVADADGRLANLADDLAALSSTLATVDVRLGSLANDLTALREAPSAEAPDRLARFGVALDAVVAARDGGRDVAPSLAAAQAAAVFHGGLADALAPVSDGQEAAMLDGNTLLAAYDGAYDAMRSSGPTGDEGGLFGALEDRARQMVTIRAPEGTVLMSDASDPLDKLDRLGSLIADGRFGEALVVVNGLPAGMQQAGGGLIDALHARVALDEALVQARRALVGALAADAPDTQGAADAPSTDPTGQ